MKAKLKEVFLGFNNLILDIFIFGLRFVHIAGANLFYADNKYNFPKKFEWNEYRNFARNKIRGYIPNMITLGSILCAIISMGLSLGGSYQEAAALIVVATLLDFIDGKVARLLEVESDAGAILDNLADFASFGLATAVIVFSIYMQEFPKHATIGLIITVYYLIATVWRLMFFLISKHDEKPGMFRGMPSTAASAFVVSTVLMNAHIIVILITTVIASLAMVSFGRFWPKFGAKINQTELEIEENIKSGKYKGTIALKLAIALVITFITIKFHIFGACLFIGSIIYLVVGFMNKDVPEYSPEIVYDENTDTVKTDIIPFDQNKKRRGTGGV